MQRRRGHFNLWPPHAQRTWFGSDSDHEDSGGDGDSDADDEPIGFALPSLQSLPAGTMDLPRPDMCFQCEGARVRAWFDQARSQSHTACALVEEATTTCVQCKENFCAECWPVVHRGVFMWHKESELVPQDDTADRWAAGGGGWRHRDVKDTQAAAGVGSPKPDNQQAADVGTVPLDPGPPVQAVPTPAAPESQPAPAPVAQDEAKATDSPAPASQARPALPRAKIPRAKMTAERKAEIWKLVVQAAFKKAGKAKQEDDPELRNRLKRCVAAPS